MDYINITCWIEKSKSGGSFAASLLDNRQGVTGCSCVRALLSFAGHLRRLYLPADVGDSIFDNKQCNLSLMWFKW